jgi:two-component system, LytTR family, response regulator
MIRCLLVDDEQHAVDILIHYIKQIPFLHLEAATTNPLDALKIIHAGQADLIFLDIQMPEISGIDFIKAINGKEKVILTTAYSEFAMEGFDLEVVDYLLKPIVFPRFLKAAQRAMHSITAQRVNNMNDDTIEDDYVFVKTEQKGKMLKVNLKDIDYIEGMKNYVAIHHNRQKTLVYLNMKDLEERLPRKYFRRIHKSFIVAVNKITAIDGNNIILNNQKTDIVLGETYKTAFYEIMKGKMI